MGERNEKPKCPNDGVGEGEAVELEIMEFEAVEERKVSAFRILLVGDS